MKLWHATYRAKDGKRERKRFLSSYAMWQFVTYTQMSGGTIYGTGSSWVSQKIRGAK